MPEHTPAPTSSRAVYGFVLYLSFKMFFIVFLVWSIIPEKCFKFVGITCLPLKYWAVTVPICLLIVLAAFAFIIYPTFGLIITPYVNHLSTICDLISSKVDHSRLHLEGTSSKCKNICCIDKTICYKVDYEQNCGDFEQKIVPILRDLPMWEVSEKLYLK